MKKFKNVYWWFFLRYQAVHWVKRINLGNEVRFNGEKWNVLDGSVSDVWKLSNEKETIMAKRSECKLVLSFSNLRRSYRYAVIFYETNWLRTWKESGKIEDWMRCVLK